MQTVSSVIYFFNVVSSVYKLDFVLMVTLCCLVSFQAAGGDNCCMCGGATGKMAKCDNCPRNFHLQCLEPPLSKYGLQLTNNRPFSFSSCLLPLCQIKSLCETIQMKVYSLHRFIFM